MTGNDDGGFSPHPGDPWHPGWDPETESDDESLSGADASLLDEQPKKKRRRFGRRSRDEDPTEDSLEDPVGVAEPELSAPDPAAVSISDPDPDPPAVDGDDPFDAVLRAEGRSVRRRPEEADDAPVPDWTSDQEIPDELNLPVTPPSWVGDTTATDPAIEASGFEPVETSAEPVDQPDLFAPVEDGLAQEAEVESVATDDEAVEPVADGPAEIAGEFGVAGPEAFDELTDTAEEDLGDWEAFMEGAADPATPDVPQPESVEFATPAEPLADGDAFDEWVESEPRQKRRWFGRREKDPVAEDLGEWSDELATDDAAVDDTVFMPPETTDPVPAVAEDPDAAVAEALAVLGAADTEVEPLTAPVEDTIVWSADEGDVAWADEIVGDLEAESGVETASEDAIAGIEVPLTLDEVTVEDEAPADDEVTTDVEPMVLDGVVDEADEVDETQGATEAALDESVLPDPVVVEESTESTDAEQPFFLGELPEDDDDEPRAEESADWDGDGSQVPASWFADVDEDEVVPPVASDTPETEWPAREGPWEGRTAWETEESTEVFDVESAPAPAESSVEIPPVAPVEPVVPEGYEQWNEAVTEATADAGEETAEYHIQHVPAPSQELPEGFEPFPGSEADVAYGDGSVHPEDQRMPSDDTFEEAPVAYVDDVEGEEPEFDEQIYAGGGTVEHRGLAEAIAAVGEDDDTEWQAMSAAMPGVETGVLGFEDVADLASGDEYVAPVRSNLGMRVLTGLVLMGMLGGSLFVGGWAFALFVGAIVVLGLGELYTTLSRQGYLPLTLFGLVGAAGTLVSTWFHGPIAIPAGIMLTGVAVFFFYAFAPTRRDALTNGGVTLLGLAWAVGAIAFAIPIARGTDFEVLVFAVVVATAAMDIGAYSVGRRFGRRPMAPVLSPNKTIEGLFGGAVLALAAAGAFGFFEIGPFDLKAGLALGAIVVVMAPLGDLAESMIKRSMGVKDMGSTLPGHGGVLDRIDALVFVIPGAWVLFEVLGYLG